MLPLTFDLQESAVVTGPRMDNNACMNGSEPNAGDAKDTLVERGATEPKLDGSSEHYQPSGKVVSYDL